MKALILGVVTAFFGHEAFACSCMEGYPTASRVLKENHSVFLGVPAENSKKAGDNLLRTKFTVVKNFKNASNINQNIYTDDDDGANCGLSFKKNSGVMLVQTERYQGKTWTNVCAVDTVDYENRELTVLIKNLAIATRR